MAVHSATANGGFAGAGGDPLRNPLLLSAGGHVGLAGLILASLLLGPKDGGWGEGGPGGSVTVRLVGAASVPLPAPAVATANRVATENKGLHYPEPPKETAKKQIASTKAPPPEKEVELPGSKARQVRETPRPETRLRTPGRERELGNEIPYGQGGPAQGPYGVFSSDAGTGGFRFTPGTGDFGSRYGWYVTAIRNRISANWLKATVDPGVRVAPRVYVAFQILRNGSIVNPQLTASSGIASLDRSALRAVYDSNPMPALPPDYPQSSVAVEFWFDFRR